MPMISIVMLIVGGFCAILCLGMMRHSVAMQEKGWATVWGLLLFLSLAYCGGLAYVIFQVAKGQATP